MSQMDDGTARAIAFAIIGLAVIIAFVLCGGTSLFDSVGGFSW